MAELPIWVDARERQPVFHRAYFCKIDGQKQILSWHEIERALDRYDKVLWLEEAADVFVAAPVNPNAYIFKKFDEELEEVAVKSITNNTTTQPLAQDEVVHITTEKLFIPLPEIAAKETTISAAIMRYQKILTEIGTKCQGRPRRSMALDNSEKTGKLLIAAEYGQEYVDACKCGFENPTCPINESDPFSEWKFRVRYAIIMQMASDKKLNVIGLMPEFNLWNVRKLFPFLTVASDIPEALQAQILWIYGLTGFRIIKGKLRNTSKIKQWKHTHKAETRA